MKIASPSAALLAGWLAWACCATAQSTGPAATPTSLSFSYTVNSTTFPTPATVKVTVPTALAGLTLQVTQTAYWLAVTPETGTAPLTLTVTVNPTGLSPGPYPAEIYVDTQSPPTGHPATIAVSLTVLNAPAQLSVISPQYPNQESITMVFNYTTGAGNILVPVPNTQVTSGNCYATEMELDVSSTGGIIPFTVTAANVKSTGTSGGTGTTAVWTRVRVPGQGQLATTSTSGVANTGSYAPFCVSGDLPTVETLNPGTYNGQVTIAPTSSVNGSATVALVNLTVAAGFPKLQAPPVTNPDGSVPCNQGPPLFPNCIVANPAVNPVFTIYGDNFFNTTVVSLIPPGVTTPISGVTTTILSRQVLQATVPLAYFATTNMCQPSCTYPVIWAVNVSNPQTTSNPQPQVVAVPGGLQVLDPTQPLINQVVNAASYLPTSTFTGTPASNNPDLPLLGPTVAPREIISIFGANFGPSGVFTAQTTPCQGETGVQCYPDQYTTTATAGATTWTAAVTFSFTAPEFSGGSPIAQSFAAPIIMYSGNQINAIVPYEVANLLLTSGTSTSATIQLSVSNSAGFTATTAPYQVTVMQEDPGIFTLASAGQGQAAVLNQDYSINGAKNQAARGSTIQIYATGMGELKLAATQLNPNPLPDADGTVAIAAVPLSDQTVVVEFGGVAGVGSVPGVVTYAGTSEGSIDGLVQINAIVPPNAPTGTAVPLTVSIGSPSASHITQTGATIGVK